MRTPVALVAITLFAAGCQTLAPARAGRSYEGRFALTADSGNHRDSANGRFTLAVRSDGLTLDLASPFGTTIARIESAPGIARLIVPGNADASRSDPGGLDALTQHALGWRLPVGGLSDWIDGHPAPALTAAARTAAAGDVFVQQGWTISVVERFDGGSPRQLKMERPADAESPAMSVKLILDHPPVSSQ
jgi:outer membrane lipoprotein LolB